MRAASDVLDRVSGNCQYINDHPHSNLSGTSATALRCPPPPRAPPPSVWTPVGLDPPPGAAAQRGGGGARRPGIHTHRLRKVYFRPRVFNKFSHFWQKFSHFWQKKDDLETAGYETA